MLESGKIGVWDKYVEVGPLMGVLMSHVNYKKCQCRMSLSLTFPHVPCRFYQMSMARVTMISKAMSLSLMSMSPFRI